MGRGRSIAWGGRSVAWGGRGIAWVVEGVYNSVDMYL